jgi:hypothetical protein
MNLFEKNEKIVNGFVYLVQSNRGIKKEVQKEPPKKINLYTFFVSSLLDRRNGKTQFILNPLYLSQP